MGLKPGYKQTEVGVIPEEWELLAFDTLGKVIDGDRGVNYPSDQEFRQSGHCLFLNAGNVTKDGFRFDECAFITREKDAKLRKGKLKRKDIVLTTRGTVGNFAYFDSSVPFDNLRINSGMVILRNESPRLTPRYLYALVQSHSVGMQIERLSFGSAQPQLTVKGISKLGIAVPSVSEQRAIAEALSDVDALIGALDRLIAKKRDLKQAAMQQLLSGQKRLPGFSGEWERKTLLETTDCLDSVRVPLNEEQRAQMRGDIPYCGANGVLDYVNDYVIDDDIILIAEDGGYFDEYAFRPIAYRMVGKCWVNNHAHILKSKAAYDQGFVFYSLVHKNILPFLASGHARS